MSGRFIVQRAGDGRATWFDWKSFDTREQAVRARDFDLASQRAIIHGAGGSNWSGRRIQAVRVVEVVS